MSDHAQSAGATVFDLQPPEDRASQLRRLPRLTWRALRLVWDADRTHLVATVLLQAAATATIMVQLLASRELLVAAGDVSNGGAVSSLYPWLAAVALCAAALGVITALTTYEQKLLVELASRYAFNCIIDVSASVDLESFERSEFFDQLQRARNSGLYRLIDMVNSVTALTTGVLTSVGIAVVLFILQPLLLPFVALAAIFPLIATILNSRQAYVFEYAMTPESRERQYLMELLTERQPAQEVRIFGSGPFLRQRYNALTAERLRRLRIFLGARLKVALLGSGGGMIGTAIGLVALIVLLRDGQMTIATALTAALAMQQLGGRLAGLTASVGRLIESGMFIDDFDAFVRLADEIEAAPAPKPETSSRPRLRSVEVEQVSFAYPGTRRAVLEDVSLEVGPGEVVALVGENGSGKTTLVKLICGLYQPTGGRILWNGEGAAAVDPAAVLADTTLLFQDYIQYHLSVHDNIVLGRPEAPIGEDAIAAAAVRAGAAGFIDALPSGYETRLGREFYGGHELSVGQWQRLALARAFYRGGSFLVLDEPTASLDPRAEAALFAQMRELARGRSVLLVSHRFSSVRSADRIYLLEQGRVTEGGDHETLVAAGGRYAELYALQSEAYLAEPLGV